MEDSKNNKLDCSGMPHRGQTSGVQTVVCVGAPTQLSGANKGLQVEYRGSAFAHKPAGLPL